MRHHYEEDQPILGRDEPETDQPKTRLDEPTDRPKGVAGHNCIGSSPGIPPPDFIEFNEFKMAVNARIDQIMEEVETLPTLRRAVSMTYTEWHDLTHNKNNNNGNERDFFGL